jgi:hypothetical protein
VGKQHVALPKSSMSHCHTSFTMVFGILKVILNGFRHSECHSPWRESLLNWKGIRQSRRQCVVVKKSFPNGFSAKNAVRNDFGTAKHLFHTTISKTIAPFDLFSSNEQSAEANEQSAEANEQSAEANEQNLSRMHCST